MPKRIWTDRPLVLFLVMTLVLGMALQTVFAFDPRSLWPVLAMWMPTVAVLAMRTPGLLVLSNLRRFELKWIGVGLALGILPNLLAQIFYFAFGLGDWNSSVFALAPNGTGVEKIEHLKLVLGTGAQSFSFLAMNVLLTLFLAGFITTFSAALGEEIGWRGFLQPNLNHKYGEVPATFIVAAIWAYWHLPSNLAGYNGREHVYLVSFLTFPIMVLFLSFVLNWLRIRSGAIWPCAFLHGFYNTSSALSFWRPKTELIESIVNLSSAAVVGLVFVWLLARRQSRPDESIPSTSIHLPSYGEKRA